MRKWLGRLLLRWLQRRYVVDTIYLALDAQMWRICFRGYYEGRWFARLDWGSRGWRLTRKEKAEHKMEAVVRDLQPQSPQTPTTVRFGVESDPQPTGPLPAPWRR